MRQNFSCARSPGSLPNVAWMKTPTKSTLMAQKCDIGLIHQSWIGGLKNSSVGDSVRAQWPKLACSSPDCSVMTWISVRMCEGKNEM